MSPFPSIEPDSIAELLESTIDGFHAPQMRQESILEVIGGRHADLPRIGSNTNMHSQEEKSSTYQFNW